MRIEVKAYGLKNAEDMMVFLRECGAQSVGAVLTGRTRQDKPGLTNADVIKYLADGVERADGTIVQRDLGPCQADADGARALYLAQVKARLATLSAKMGNTQTTAVGTANAMKLAETANSSGLMAGAKAVAALMKRRAEAQLTVHTGSEQQADSVTAPYARRRQQRYGVAGSVVYRASGQILRNLGPGNVRLVRGAGILAKLRGLIG